MAAVPKLINGLIPKKFLPAQLVVQNAQTAAYTLVLSDANKT